MTRTPSVRERVAQFMEAMHRKDFAEAKRIRRFSRMMCSPQHWSGECRLWLERNPDTDPPLKAWFERACQEHKRSLDPDPQYLRTRPWSLDDYMLQQAMQRRHDRWWQHLD